MLSTTKCEAAISPALPARLRLQEDHSGPTVLDGGWWPRSADPATELPGLILALDKRHGRIARVMLGAADWKGSRPRQLRQRPADQPAHRPPAHQREGRSGGHGTGRPARESRPYPRDPGRCHGGSAHPGTDGHGGVAIVRPGSLEAARDR